MKVIVLPTKDNLHKIQLGTYPYIHTYIPIYIYNDIKIVIIVYR